MAYAFYRSQHAYYRSPRQIMPFQLSILLHNKALACPCLLAKENSDDPCIGLGGARGARFRPEPTKPHGSALFNASTENSVRCLVDVFCAAGE